MVKKEKLLTLLEGYLPLHRFMSNTKYAKPYQKRILYGLYLYSYDPFSQYFSWIPISTKTPTREIVHGEYVPDLLEFIRKNILEALEGDTETFLQGFSQKFKECKKIISQEEATDRVIRKYKLASVLTYSRNLENEYLSKGDFGGTFLESQVSALIGNFALLLDIHLQKGSELESLMDKHHTSSTEVTSTNPKTTHRRAIRWARNIMLHDLCERYSKNYVQEDFANDLREVFPSLKKPLRIMVINEFSEKTLIDKPKIDADYNFNNEWMRVHLDEVQKDIQNAALILEFLLEDSRINLLFLYTREVLCLLLYNKHWPIQHVKKMDSKMREMANDHAVELVPIKDYWNQVANRYKITWPYPIYR